MNENEKTMHEWLTEIDLFLETAKEEKPLFCDYCGREINTADYININGKTLCDDCRSEHVYECTACGELCLDDDDGLNFVHDEPICNYCMDMRYEVCVECGEIERRTDMWNTENGYVCDYCRDEYYRYCINCDRLEHIDNMIWDEYEEEYYCENCYEERRNRPIHPYNYKPTPIFYGGDECENPLYMGVELEIDKGGEDSDNAEILLDTMNTCDEYIYIKHDGSIYNGFEIVSHPATLDYHANNMKWSRLFQKALSMDYRSHETETCGLHVHVSRRALGDTYDERENTIAKIVYFMENNWDDIVQFTRRNESNLSRWANRYGLEDTPEHTYEKAKTDWNRYRSINLLNDSTIEFRVFRGTLRYGTFIATLQFVNDVCAICRRFDMATIEKMGWYKFVSLLPTEHEELRHYLQRRDLF